MNHNYFIFDENSCVGCEACVVSCVLENGFQFPNNWRTIYSSNESKIPGIPLINLSLSCNHCGNAPCLKYCPSLAFTKDDDTGAITIDSKKCIGCSYCLWNCPYEAPKYNPVSGVVEKCDFCNSRLSEHSEPACSSSCPTGALSFSFDEIEKSELPTVIEVPLNPFPSILIHEIESKSGPEIDNSLFERIPNPAQSAIKKSKISAIIEIPLLVFTMIVSTMVATTATSILQSQDKSFKISFIIVGVAAATISMLHLGHRFRFWRSVLNIRNSWLSREILFFTCYLILSSIDLLIFDVPNSVLVLLGLITLLSIDMVYKPVQWDWKVNWRSGQVLFIAVSLFLLISQSYIILVALMTIRITISFYHCNNIRSHLLKIMFRFVFPLIAGLLLLTSSPLWLIIVVFLTGEVIDRIYFYNDLEIHEVEVK